MSSFEAVAQFVGAHRGCGTITPTTSPAGPGGYLLTLSCSCGKTFERWITSEESESGLGAVPPAPPTPVSPARPEVLRPEPPAIDAPTSTPDAPPVTPAAAPASPPAAAPAATGPPAAEPLAAPAPASPAATSPFVPPPAPLQRPPRADTPKPDRRSLEDALLATLQALDAAGEVTADREARAPVSRAAATPTTGPTRREAAPGPAAAPDATRGGRAVPDKQSLQDALRATLSALEDERRAAGPAARALQAAMPLGADPLARRKKKLSVPVAIAIAVLLAGAVAAGYGLRGFGQPPAEVAAPPRPAPRVRVTENERAAVSQVMSVLREVQGVSRVDVPYRVYFNRVSFAKADVDRHLENVKDAELRSALAATMALHVLAAAAWRAKTLNERERWEAVGDDPGIELCPGTRRILAIGDEPANMSRAHWRGMALAAGLPLLWDCAAERLAEVDRGLSK